MRFICFPLFFLSVLLSACRHHKDIQQVTYDPPKLDTLKKGSIPNDLQVIVTEEMLNKSLKALGPISGKEPYDIMVIKDTFTWTLIGSYMKLHPGKADFFTKVNILAGKISYTTNCAGDVDIWFDRAKNLINVKIKKCLVEIYTRIFGVRYHITDYDIASQFTEPFTFAGPTATSSEMPMEMPDGSVRTLYMTTTDCDLTVQEKQIVVPCEVGFSLTKPK